jgi:hypothetical protein
MVRANVLFEALKTWVYLNLARLNVVKLAVFEDVRRSAGIPWKLFWPEISSYAKIRIMAASYYHLTCVPDARNGVWSNLSS